MSYYILFFSLLTAALFSCKSKPEYSERPLASVIKLFSAEEVKDFNEAIKYIDVDRVYADCKKENKDPVECWKEKVNFSYNLGQTRKFTNHFNYYNYKIKESVNGKNAIVEFTPIINNTGEKTMILILELIKGSWVVIKINHF